MSTITIVIPGEELENLNIELSTEEVTALYKLRKEQASKIVNLEKKVSDLESSKKYKEDQLEMLQAELQQAHTLLSVLGIQEKTAEEEAYYHKPLQVATRIALYIAGVKTACRQEKQA